MLDMIRMTQGTVMQKNQIEVAIGLLFSKTRVLVGWRNAQQHQGNKAEFPGGRLNRVKQLSKLVAVKCLKKLE